MILGQRSGGTPFKQQWCRPQLPASRASWTELETLAEFVFLSLRHRNRPCGFG